MKYIPITVPLIDEPKKRVLTPDDLSITDPVQREPPNASGIVIPKISPVAEARANYEDELARPADRKGIGQQLLYGTLQVLANTFGGQQKPYEGLGTAQKRVRVEQAGQQLGALQKAEMSDLELQKQRLQVPLIEAQIKNTQSIPEIKQAQIELGKTRETNRQLETQNKFGLQQKNFERLVQAEKNKGIREGNKYDVQNIDGYLYRVFKNDPTREPEAIIDPRTGTQAFNPADVAQEITFEDGTKAWAKGGQIVSGKFAAERQASQQTFQAGENDKNRALKIVELNTQVQKWVTDNAQRWAKDAEAKKHDYATQMRILTEAKNKGPEKGGISQAEFDRLVRIMNGEPEPKTSLGDIGGPLQ